MKLRFLLIAAACLLMIPSFAFAQESAPQAPPAQAVQTDGEPTTGAVVADVLLVRPFSMIGSIVSTAVGIGLMPIAFLTGTGEQLARITIEAPWRFTVARPLGEYDKYRDGKPITVVHR